MGVRLVEGRVHRGREGGGEGGVGHELWGDHTHLAWLYMVVSMRVVRLKGFLTYEDDPGTVVGVCVVTRGGVVGSWHSVMGRGGVVVGHTVLLDCDGRLWHGVGMVCVWWVMLFLRSSRAGLGYWRGRARRLSHFRA